MSTSPDAAVLLAGVPSLNKAVFHRVHFAPHDPVSFIALPNGRSVMIVRDVELPRARAGGRADEVQPYEAFAPEGGLSGDRAIRAAEATAECLVRHDVRRVIADRTLPLIYVDELRRRGIDVACDRDLGIRERRQKDADEIKALRTAQAITEEAMRLACELIARADTDDEGRLVDPEGGELLTSEAVKTRIDLFLAARQCASDGHIVCGGAQGADCHEAGAGVLRSGEPVLVDIFPRHLPSGYHGDCTRTVVHGRVSETVAKMHAAVVEAKAAALSATRAGVTGETVHRAATAVLERHGYATGYAADGAAGGSMPHGTGHGIGLDLKEPPLLDLGGPELLVGDAITVEPGLYAPEVGGVRIEDLVIVTESGCDSLNALPEDLDWR